MSLRCSGIILVSMTLGACAHTGAENTSKPKAFECPKGTQMVGKPPPKSFNQTCMTKGKVPQGPARVWHQNGQIKEQGTYQNGHRHGEWNFWYDNGQQAGVIHYNQGQRHGRGTAWHRNGQKQGYHIYKDDKEHGEWIFCHDN